MTCQQLTSLMALKDEMVMSKDFRSSREEAFFALVRTAEMVHGPHDRLFRSCGLSSAQYNVLRILRGAGPAGCTCGEIDRRLLKRGPDVTRLIDRLKATGLVTRQRSQEDRRVVRVILTDAAHDLLTRIEAPGRQTLDEVMAGIDEQQAEDLVAILQQLREHLERLEAASAEG
jgi:DNA-binding MarR family transcriptional regulator